MFTRAVALSVVLLMLHVGNAMADPSARAGRVVSRSIPELLQVVESKPGATNPAIVRVTLRNALQFEGQVTSYDARKGVCVIAGDHGQTTIIELGNIVAVTIITPGSAKTALQGGLIYREEGDEAPTFISLRRSAESVAKQNNTVVELSLPDTSSDNLDCRFAANRMLLALDAALKDISADKLGQDALRRFTKGVRLTHEAGASSQWKNGGQYIDVRFDCTAPLFQDYETALANGLKKLL